MLKFEKWKSNYRNEGKRMWKSYLQSSKLTLLRIKVEMNGRSFVKLNDSHKNSLNHFHSKTSGHFWPSLYS